jgi:hypothetical protein
MKILHNLKGKPKLFKALRKSGYNEIYKNFTLHYPDNQLIEDCDVLIYGETSINHMFRKHSKPKNQVNINKIIILCDNEGGFDLDLILTAQKSISEKYQCNNVYILTQNELVSRNRNNIGYINLSWLRSYHINYFPKGAHNLKPEEKPYFYFNCTFGTFRDYKYNLYLRLQKENLLDHHKVAYLSGSQRNAKLESPYLKSINVDLHSITNRDITINGQVINNASIEEYFINKMENQSNTKLDQLYMMVNSRFTLTIETEMHNESNRYTEKSMKPIAIHQPFLIAGNYKVLDLLKQDGFQTFHPFIDESYDNIQNTEERINCIIKELNRLMCISMQDWQKLLKKMQPILKHNHQHLMNMSSQYCNTILDYIKI